MIQSIALEGGSYIGVILLAIFIAIIIPLTLFIIGLVKYSKNKKQGKIILIIAAVYAIISFGICGGFGF
ncbi:hypothetical protein [Psychroserpens sp. MEBiC05023]